MASLDGTRVLPPQPAPTLTDSSGVSWSISYPNYWALKNGVATNGHASEILFFGGAIYCKSPTGGIWWKYLGGKAWLKLDTNDPAGTTPPPPGGHGLTASLDFGGGQVANFSAGTDMGDFVGEFVRQKCYLALDPAFPDWRVFFRPDAGASRDEVVVEYGRATAGTPKNIGKATPYTATIKKAGATVYTVTVPGHYWYARWRWKSSDRPVVRDVATLKARGLIPNYTTTGLFGATAYTCSVQWPGPMRLPSDPCGGSFSQGMASGGDNDAIGLMTEYAAQYAVFGGANLLTSIRTEGEWCGNWSTHLRDDAGVPIDTLTKKYKSDGGTINDCPTDTVYPEGSEPGYVFLDSAHMYPKANMAWLLTDDPFYLEEIHGVLSWVMLEQPSANYPGLMRIDQTRGYGWGLRDLFLAVKTTPAVTPSWMHNKAHWQLALTNNLAFSMKYVNGPSRLSTIFRTWTITAFDGSWQTSWLNAVVGQAVLMGFAEWKPVFDWAVDGHIQMTNGTSGWPRQWPAPYYWFPKKSGGAIDLQIYDLDGHTDATNATSWADAWAYYASGGGGPASPSASDERGIPIDAYGGGPQANWDTTTLYQKYAYQGIGTLTESHLQALRAELAIAISNGIPGAQACYDWIHSKVPELMAKSGAQAGQVRFSIDPVTGGPPPPPPPTGALSTLAAGKVRKLGPYGAPGVYASDSIIDDSGSVLDGKRMIFGLGGHGPSNGNAFRGLDFTTLQCTDLYPTTPYVAQTLANMDSVLGRFIADNKPFCRHTYGLLSVVGRKLYCLQPLGMPFHPQGSPDSANIFEPQWGGRMFSYDMVAGTFEYSKITGAPTNAPWYQGGGSCPDPISGKIVVIGTDPQAGGTARAWLYDTAADSLQQIAVGTGGLIGVYQNKVFLDSVADRFVSISNDGTSGIPQVFELTINRSNQAASTLVKVMPTGQVPSGFAAGFGWDDAKRRAGGGVNRGKFYIYNAVPRTWETQLMTLETGGPATMSMGTGYACEFDKDSDCYHFLAYWQGAYGASNVDGNAYAYRPA